MNRRICTIAPPPWMVVTTQPHREAFASMNLERQHYNVYCPKIIKRIRHARRVLEVPRPLFPGYLFVQAPRQEWRPILGTYGVRSVVCTGDCPSFLPSGFVESLRAREIHGALRKQDALLKAGQVVTINGGAFDGLIGRIIEIRENDRVLMLLNLLNQQSKVHVDAESLSPA